MEAAREEARGETGAAGGDPRPERPISPESARAQATAAPERAAAAGRDAAATHAPPGGPPAAGAAPRRADQRLGGAGTAPPGSGPDRPAPRSTGASPRGSGSWLAGLAAGVIGGIVAALALTWALARDSAEVAALRAQVDRLEQALAGVEGQGGGAALEDEIRGRIEALVAADAEVQERLDALGTGAQGGAGAELEALTARVDELQAAAADAATGAPSEAVTQRLSELESSLRELSTRLGQLQEAVPAAGAAGEQSVAELTTRMEALEGRLRQAEQAGQDAQQLTSRIGALEQQMAGGQQAAAGLTGRVEALGGQLGALSTRMDVLGETVDQLHSRLVTSEDRRTRAATLALIVAQLDAALDGGAPFEELLEGLRALGADDPAVVDAIEALQPVAASGVPGVPELRNAFDPVANEIVHAERAPDGDGLLDQAAGNLMRLVTVRPVGADVEGDGAAARVARAEAALAEGDLAAAAAELEGLEGAAAAAAAPWLADVRARLAAQHALAVLQDRTTRLLSEVE